MTLQKKDKNTLVSFRLQRANETLAEVKGTIKLGYWRVAANRLYYTCFLQHLRYLSIVILQHTPIRELS
jgi:hypothetical protein